MQNENNTTVPSSANPDVRGATNQSSTSTKAGDPNSRPRRQTFEEIILGILRESAKKAGTELEGLVLAPRIAEAEELAVKKEWREVNAKAINYAKGIAAAKKFHAHHLLRELGIKLPSDGGCENAADKKVRRNTSPASSGNARPDSGKTPAEKITPGNAGEVKS